MIENFLLNPFFATILVAFSASLLGVFVLWKKMSYFGDALSHAVLLGLILGAMTQSNQVISMIFFAVVFAATTHFIAGNRYFSKDTIIMAASYFAVGLAVIFNDLWQQNFSFSSYIFGDVLAVENADIWLLFLTALVVAIYTISSFKKLLLINVNQDLAQIEGINASWWNLSFSVVLALVIALSIQIIGLLLVTALLVLPAAIARIFAFSPKQMMLLSPLIAVMVASLSFKTATAFELTVGPAIIVGFSLVFVLSLIGKKIFFHDKF